MDLRFHRLEEATSAHESEKWTPWARAILYKHRLLARTNRVVMRSETEGLVRQLNDNVYTIDLQERTCSCLAFQENRIPYKHAISAIFAIPDRDLVPYMPETLTVDT